MPEKHSKLACSASHRWLNCSASALLPIYSEPRDTTEADEGTLVHSLSELKLTRSLWSDNEEELKEIRNDPLYKPEMEFYSDEYIRFIESKKYKKRYIEKLVSLDFIQQGLFGTCDCILMNPSTLESDTLLEIVDLKYGRYKVEVKNNSQLLLYALGASYLFIKEFPEIKRQNFKIKLNIFQPRIKNISSWTIDFNHLMKWTKKVLQPALKRIREQQSIENKGDWCKWCDSKIFCRSYNQAVQENIRKESVVCLDDKEVTENYFNLLELEKLLKTTKSYLTKTLESGKELPGLKLTEGRKTRSWKDPEETLKIALNNNLEIVDVISPAKAEKLIGKKQFEILLSDLVETKQGNPILKQVKEES